VNDAGLAAGTAGFAAESAPSPTSERRSDRGICTDSAEGRRLTEVARPHNGCGTISGPMSQPGPDDAAGRAQAGRERMTLRKSRLGEPEVDLSPVFGAEAISLVYRLTRTSYSLAGAPQPTCTRASIPIRFVPGRAT